MRTIDHKGVQLSIQSTPSSTLPIKERPFNTDWRGQVEWGLSTLNAGVLTLVRPWRGLTIF